MKKDYYVYLHHLEDGTIFYVGKGRLDRAYHKYGRSNAWEEITKYANYTVSFYQTNLDETTALNIESDLISKLPNIINRTAEKRVIYSKEEYEKYFKIDSESPSNLSRIQGGWNGYYHRGKLGPCGYTTNANLKKSNTYWKISLNGRSTLIHHIVWILAGNTLENNMIIDHIDGNGLNNHISNLRQISKASNCKSKRLYKNNTFGISGIALRSDSYVARLYIDDRRVSRSFSISKYDSQELALKAAQEWRAERIAELNKQGAGYTERHGT